MSTALEDNLQIPAAALIYKMPKKTRKKAKVLKHKTIRKKNRVVKHTRKTKKEDKEMKHPKSQIFSIDTMIATMIFIAAITGLLVYIGLSNESQVIEEITFEAELIPKMLVTTDQGDLSLLTMNKIDANRLAQLAQIPYQQLKDQLGVKYDFCIYFEDSNGNLVDLSEIIDLDYVGIGSPEASVAGIPCGTG